MCDSRKVWALSASVERRGNGFLFRKLLVSTQAGTSKIGKEKSTEIDLEKGRKFSKKGTGF